MTYLLIFQAKIDFARLYQEFADRIIEAVPDSVRLDENLFLVGDCEKLNAAQDNFCGLLVECDESVSYYALMVSSPVCGSFDAEIGKRFCQIGLEINNMPYRKKRIDGRVL